MVRSDGTNEGKALLLFMHLLPSNKDVLQIFIFQFLLGHQLEHTDTTNLQKKYIYHLLQINTFKLSSFFELKTISTFE